MSSKLNPIEKVPLSNGDVEVRQMPFLKTLEFLKLLSAEAGKLFDSNGKFVVGKSADGKVQVDVAVLKEIIVSTSDLALFLMEHSIVGKDRQWLASLSTAEGLAILTKSLEMNLSNEIIDMGKNIAVFLSEAFGRKTAETKTTSLKPSTS